MTNYLHNLMAAEQRVLLVGPPGCAKTERVKKAAKDNGRRLVVIRAALSERVDFGGCLIPDIEAGVTKALPLEKLFELENTTEPILLFLDDLGQAPMDVQSAAMGVFDENALSDNVLIWGATNRPGDVAGVSRLCEPLRSRFHMAFAIATQDSDTDSPDGAEYLGTWGEEVAGWCEWALNAGAPPEVVAWQRSTSGRTLYQWKPHADPAVRMPDFRSWETVIDLWNKGLRDMRSVSAAIGKPTAAEFLAFARLADQLPTPDQVWIDPDGTVVPDDPAALYLVCSMLAGAADAKHAQALVTYLTRLPRVYGALLARDAFRRLGAKLSGTKAWAQWFIANEELFAVGEAA